MRKFTLIFFALACTLLFAVPALAAGAKIAVNGVNLSSDVPPEIEKTSAMVPLRALSEALGADLTWDEKSNTATVQKNGKKLSVSPGKNTVMLNGSELALDNPVKQVNNRILIPAQVLEKLLGVKITVADATGSINVLNSETVAGMTPEALLTKSNEAMLKFNTYKYKGDFSMTTTAPSLFKSHMTMEGAYQKPDETYFIMNMSLPAGTPGPAGQPAAMKMEWYIKGAKMYQNLNGEGWKKLDLALPTQLLESQNTSDPVKSLEQIKKIGGLISAGTPEKVNGKDYYTLKVTLDPDKLLEYTKNIMSEAAASAGSSISGTSKDDFNKTMEGLLKMMEMKISYKLYVDSASYLMDKMDMNEEITLNMPALKSTTTVNGTFGMYDFNTPVTMPKIPVE